jgi:hypothetical protein
MTKYQYNDGGRREAGYKGMTHDCVVRSIAIILQKPYKEVYSELCEMGGRSPRLGVERRIYHRYLLSRGMQWTFCLKVGQRYPHLDGDLPKGRIICSVRGHLTAVVDGVIQDTFDPVGEGRGVVYGYYRFRSPLDLLEEWKRTGRIIVFVPLR